MSLTHLLGIRARRQFHQDVSCLIVGNVRVFLRALESSENVRRGGEGANPLRESNDARTPAVDLKQLLGMIDAKLLLVDLVHDDGIGTLQIFDAALHQVPRTSEILVHVRSPTICTDSCRPSGRFHSTQRVISFSAFATPGTARTW